MIEALSEETKNFGRRSNLHHAYADVLLAVARSGVPVEAIATRIGRTPEEVRRKMAGPRGWTLNDISDYMLAINMRAEIHIENFDISCNLPARAELPNDDPPLETAELPGDDAPLTMTDPPAPRVEHAWNLDYTKPQVNGSYQQYCGRCGAGPRVQGDESECTVPAESPGYYCGRAECPGKHLTPNEDCLELPPVDGAGAAL